MKPFEKIVHKGKQICVVDISDSKPEEAVVYLKNAQKEIASLPPKSALVITDATNAVYNKESSAAMKEFVQKNTPYIRASAVIGADGLRSILLKTIAMITKRDIKPCKTREEAKEWLATFE